MLLRGEAKDANLVETLSALGIVMETAILIDRLLHAGREMDAASYHGEGPSARERPRHAGRRESARKRGRCAASRGRIIPGCLGGSVASEPSRAYLETVSSNLRSRTEWAATTGGQDNPAAGHSALFLGRLVIFFYRGLGQGGVILGAIVVLYVPPAGGAYSTGLGGCCSVPLRSCRPDVDR